MSIRVAADQPVNLTGNLELLLENGLLDTTLAVYSPDCSLLLQADYLEDSLATDAYLESLTLPETCVYRIEVLRYRDQTGGGYRLVLDKTRPLVFKATYSGKFLRRSLVGECPPAP